MPTVHNEYNSKEVSVERKSNGMLTGLIIILLLLAGLIFIAMVNDDENDAVNGNLTATPTQRISPTRNATPTITEDEEPVMTPTAEATPTVPLVSVTPAVTVSITE